MFQPIHRAAPSTKKCKPQGCIQVPAMSAHIVIVSRIFRGTTSWIKRRNLLVECKYRGLGASSEDVYKKCQHPGTRTSPSNSLISNCFSKSALPTFRCLHVIRINFEFPIPRRKHAVEVNPRPLSCHCTANSKQAIARLQEKRDIFNDIDDEFSGLIDDSQEFWSTVTAAPASLSSVASSLASEASVARVSLSSEYTSATAVAGASTAQIASSLASKASSVESSLSVGMKSVQAKVTQSGASAATLTTTDSAGNTITSTSTSSGGAGKAYQTGAMGAAALLGGAAVFAANI